MKVQIVPSPCDIQQAIDRIASSHWGQDIFTSGHCHTLAEALYRVNGCTGKLFACIRKTIDQDGAVYSTGYSHMVYETPDERMWDIDGEGADVRWADTLNLSDEPDKWGLTEELSWDEVPTDKRALAAWIQDHRANHDPVLVQQLINHIDGVTERTQSRQSFACSQ